MVLRTNQFLAVEDTDVPENEISGNEEIENLESEANETDGLSVFEFEDVDVQLSIISDQINDMLEKFEPTNTVTEFETPSGPIAVVHTVTLGDLLITTLLVAILIFQVLDKLIRRF